MHGYDLRENRKKWDNWSYKEKPKAMPLVNYSSAIVFALAAFVEVAGQAI